MQTLIGRDIELGQLETVLEEAKRGVQQLALISGDGGIGKTSLVEAFCSRSGLRSFWGRCWEGGGTPPYWPWVQVVRACADDLGEEVYTLAGSGGERLAGLVSGSGVGRSELGRGATESLDERVPLFEAVAAVLAAAAGGEPLLVALDDLHAADEASLQLLRHLVRERRAAPLLIIGTYREAEAAAFPSRYLALGAVARFALSIPLRGLEQEDVRTLLARSGVAVDAETTARVCEMTEGNPFLVDEAARLLAAGKTTDALLRRAAARGLVSTRLNLLTDEARSVLSGAAVLGREFSLGELGELLHRPGDDVIDVLESSARHGVADEVGLGRWAFGHALLRDALLGEIDPVERVRLHRRAAELIERASGGGGRESVARIAYHYAEAAREESEPRAVEACRRAGDAAFAALAVEEAARWYERGLEVLDGVDPGDSLRRYDMLMAFVNAVLMTDVRRALDASYRAIRVARGLGRIDLAAEAAIPGAVAAVGDVTLIGALDEALCELPEADSPLRAKVLVSFARLLHGSSFGSEVIGQICRQGVEMARRVGDPETLWTALWQWYQHTQGDIDSVDERRAVHEELVRLAGESGATRRLVLALAGRAATRLEATEIEGARADYDRARLEAERLAQPFLVWTTLVDQSRLAFHDGDIGEAERLAHEAAAMGARADWEDAQVGFEYQLLDVLRHHGRFAELEARAREGYRAWNVAGLNPRLSNLVIALVEMGRQEEARQFVEGALAEGRSWWQPLGAGEVPGVRSLYMASAMAEILYLIEDAARAALFYQSLLPYAARLVVGPFPQGICARYLGLLATAAGRFDDADVQFTAAHALHDRTGAGLWGPVTRIDHARMLLRRRGHDDRARAAQLLAAARDASRRRHLHFYEARARALLEQLAPPESLRISQEGEYWAVNLGDRSVRLRDSKGVRYLARLVAQPGQEIHALDLVAGGSEPATMGAGDAGDVLDPATKAAYRRRLDELGGVADPEDPEVRREVEFLKGELGRAVGIGGRPRKAASDAERARQSVTRVITATVERVSQADPVLGEHLRSTVRTGTFLSYAG